MKRSTRNSFIILGLFACAIAYGLFHTFGASQNDMETVQEPPPPSRIAVTDTIKMIHVPAGKFLMGSPATESGRDTVTNDERQGEVIIEKSFFLSETEVTQGQWRKVMGTNPSKFHNCGDNCPVEMVSWDDAVKFCNTLSNAEGLSPCYLVSVSATEWIRACDGYRLPTEAEWEYAVRAGTTSAFNTGNCLATDQANFDGRYPIKGCPKGKYRSAPVPVAAFPPNPWGFYDMHGNVSEWVWDLKAPYRSESQRVDVGGPLSGHQGCVYRGGDWMTGEAGCRSANRDNENSFARHRFLGFRVARSAE